MNEDDLFGVFYDDTEFATELNDELLAAPESGESIADKADTETLDEVEAAEENNPETAVAEAQTPETDAEPEPQEQQQAQAPAKPKAPRKTPAAAKKTPTREKLNPRDKAVRVILRRSGKDEVPELDHLLRNKGGKSMRICDIGLFIGEPDDEVLKELAAECKIANRVNLSAEVLLSQVKKVGASILQADRMYQPIQVARIEEDGSYECTSGRHRLAFLSLLYGPKANIKVYVEDMTLQEARDAVVVANMARPTKALERAEHAVLQAVHGDADAAQDELYKNTATTKTKVKKYCVFSVLKNKYPAELSFKLSLTASRKGGALTTITNVENFWGAALNWNKQMERAEFDEQLKTSVTFLNALAEKLQEQDGFDAIQHMSSMALSAIGKYYQDVESVTGDALGRVEDIAVAIVAMGEIGRQKSEVTYTALAKALRK